MDVQLLVLQHALNHAAEPVNKCQTLLQLRLRVPVIARPRIVSHVRNLAVKVVLGKLSQ